MLFLFLDVVITTRGCSGPKDDAGNEIAKGCAETEVDKPGASGYICYCDEDLCNTSTPNIYANTIHFVFISGLICFFQLMNFFFLTSEWMN